MKFSALTILALAAFAQAAYSAQPATLLYCNGKSPQVAMKSGAATADAIVQITDIFTMFRGLRYLFPGMSVLPIFVYFGRGNCRAPLLCTAHQP